MRRPPVPVVLALLVALVSAQQAFINPTGSDTGACPAGSPCLTAAYAFTQANEVVMQDGVYDVTSTLTLIGPNRTSLLAENVGQAVWNCAAGQLGILVTTIPGDLVSDGVVFTNCASALAGNASSCGLITNTKFINCSASSGGAIHLDGVGPWRIFDSEFVGCRAVGGEAKGGAIYARVALSLAIRNLNFTDCGATGGTFNRGGALYYEENTDQVASFTNLMFTNCFAGNGGGAYFVNTNVAASYALARQISGLTFVGCQARGVAAAGGALVMNLLQSVWTATNIGIFSCQAGISTSGATGGGMYLTSSSPTVTTINIVNCYAGNVASPGTSSFGGGLAINGGRPVFSAGVFADNFADAQGGGVWMSENGGSFNNCQFNNNRARQYGGGAMIIGVSLAPTFQSCDFTGNVMANNASTIILDPAAGGGGAYNSAAGNSPGTKFFSCTFTDNISSNNGGGLQAMGSGIVTILGTTFDSNSAAYGGGLFVGPTTNAIVSASSDFTGNTASLGGGAIHMDDRGACPQFRSGVQCMVNDGVSSLGSSSGNTISDDESIAFIDSSTTFSGNTGIAPTTSIVMCVKTACTKSASTGQGKPVGCAVPPPANAQAIVAGELPTCQSGSGGSSSSGTGGGGSGGPSGGAIAGIVIGTLSGVGCMCCIICCCFGLLVGVVKCAFGGGTYKSAYSG